jgi:3-hydroxyisobutyrate dehydrogenase-like beta-hydroxyacid dehydrogenase
MRVAFCGLGNMGRPMAARLLGAGHRVTVWNRTAGRADDPRLRAATVTATPAEAIRDAEVAITMLAHAEALEAVVFGADGLAARLAHGDGLIDMSTVGPEAIRSVAARLPAGVKLLDAPVKGGPGKAAAGELTILVGGAEEAFRRWEPILTVLGTPRYLGPSGTGAAAKVLNNFAAISLVSALGEAMALADTLGLPEELALDVLSSTPLQATVDRQWKRAGGQGPPSFRLRLAAKDLALGLDAARTAGRRLRLGEEAGSWLHDAQAEGLGDRDQAEVVNVIRRSGAGEVARDRGSGGGRASRSSRHGPAG